MKSGNLNFMEPSGPLQACNWIALPFTWLPKRIYVLNIDSVVERASGRFVGGCEGGGGVRRFPFFVSFYACLLRCASRRICSVKHTDPLYMLNTYVVIPTSAVRCSRRNIFSTDQYTGIQSQSKPSSKHQLQGASGWISHGRTPITPFEMFTNLPRTYVNHSAVLHYVTFSGLLRFRYVL